MDEYNYYNDHLLVVAWWVTLKYPELLSYVPTDFLAMLKKPQHQSIVQIFP